jgi:hypothetical protein
MPNSPVSTAETAFKIAGAVAAATPPPWGEALGAGAEVISDVLGFFFPSEDGASSSGPTLQQILAGVAQQFTHAEIQTATNAITATASIFHNQAKNAAPLPKGMTIKEATTQDPQGVFSLLYDLLQKIVGGNDRSLILPITSMATDVQGDVCLLYGHAQAAYLPTFAYGVSTYLLMTEYLVGLAFSVGGPDAVQDTEFLAAIGNLTEPFYGQNGWIGYAEAVNQSFRDAVTHRATFIHDAIPFTFPDSSIPPNPVPAVYFQDFGEPVANFDPSHLYLSDHSYGWPGNAVDLSKAPDGAVFAVPNPWSTQERADQVHEVREQYIVLMFDVFYKVNYFNPDVMLMTIDSWKKSLAKLQAAARG